MSIVQRIVTVLTLSFLLLLPAVGYSQSPVIDLPIGQQFQLTTTDTGTVVWLPPPGVPSCVSVSDKGLVTGLKLGTCGVSTIAVSEKNVMTPSRLPILFRVVPAVPIFRKVAWPKTDKGRDAALTQQWGERYRLQSVTVQGDFAIFEYVP